MGNMSYCRFQNTLRDFSECTSILDDMVDGTMTDAKPPEELSRDEFEHAVDLILAAQDLVAMFREAAALEPDGGELTADDIRDLMSGDA